MLSSVSSKSDSISGRAAVKVIFREKSSTSAFISKYSGTFSSLLSRPRLSASFGNVRPTATELLPSDVTFPFVTFILLNLSLGRVTRVARVNGTYTSSSLPFIFFMAFVLFS